MANYLKDDILGTIEPGRIADILILDADPPADSQNYGKINRTFKDSAEVDFRSLPTKRLVTDYPRSEPAEMNRY
jgi:cytosine/adenosine deaminase-related metal-dependent hydrolase